MIKVNLKNKKYRYEVFQIINLFYPLQDIFFNNDDDFNIKIDINSEKISCSDKQEKINYIIDDKIGIKEQIKKCIYRFLSLKTNKEFPWGIMIGIRPTKIASYLLNNGVSEEKIINYYADHYLVNEEKSKICIEIAKLEQGLIKKDGQKVSIYINMPFCPSRCVYCSFISNLITTDDELVKSYLNALKYEMKKLSEYIYYNNLKIDCVYFGGGTPTSIDDNNFDDILRTIYNCFIKDHNIREFTVECGRPDTINEVKLNSMKKYNVDRISINPQTMNNKTLKLIGRKHSVEEIKNKYKLARKLGFDNINMDIILGLPGESYKEVLTTCNEIEKLNPDNITVHGMCIKRGSKLYENIINSHDIKVANQNQINLMYDEVKNLIKRMNMYPYYLYRQKNMLGNMENIGYCKLNKECIYNIEMIEEQQTIIALGANAVSKIRYTNKGGFKRFANLKNVKEYTNRVEEMAVGKINLLKNA